jgi:hypothetical protein
MAIMVSPTPGKGIIMTLCMIIPMGDRDGIARRRRRFERILGEFHKWAGKKGKPTKDEEEKVLRELKEIRRDLWKKYKRWLRRMEAEKRTGIVRCSARGCRQPVDYVWVDAYLPDSRAVLERGEIHCYPLCIAHDTMLHETLDRMRAETSELTRQRIRIGR